MNRIFLFLFACIFVIVMAWLFIAEAPPDVTYINLTLPELSEKIGRYRNICYWKKLSNDKIFAAQLDAERSIGAHHFKVLNICVFGGIRMGGSCDGKPDKYDIRRKAKLMEMGVFEENVYFTYTDASPRFDTPDRRDRSAYLNYTYVEKYNAIMKKFLGTKFGNKFVQENFQPDEDEPTLYDISRCNEISWRK